MNCSNYLQQGDVLLFAAKKLPKGKLKPRTDGVIQYGEHTGHAHRLPVISVEVAKKPYEMFEDESGDLWIKVNEPVALTHEEHNPITLDPGIYRRQIVVEYDHFKEEARQVLD